MDGQSIGEVFIEVAVKGLQAAFGAIKSGIAAMNGSKVTVVADIEAAKAKVAALRQEMEKLRATNLTAAAAGFASLGSAATAAFATISGGVLGLTRLASPLDFERLTVALALAGIQLGRTFLPLIRDLTSWLNRLTSWLRQLTDAQRENVLYWTKIAVLITGVLAVLPRLVSLVSLVIGVFRGLSATFSLLAATSPFGWVVIAIGALTALGIAMKTHGNLTERLAQIWERFGTILGVLWAMIEPVLNGILGAFNKVLPVVMLVASVLADVLVPALDALADFLVFLQPLISAVLAVFVAWYAVVAPVRIAILALTTVVSGLSAAFALLFANPITATLVGIAAAAFYLTGAFSSVAKSIDYVTEKTNKLQALLDKLKQGGEVTKNDISQLPSGIKGDLLKIGDDPKKQKEYLEQLQKNAASQLKGKDEAKEALYAELTRKALAKDIENSPFEATRAKRREENLRQEYLQAGMSPGEANQRVANIRQQVDLGKDSLSSHYLPGASSTGGTLDKAQVEQAAKASQEGFLASKTLLEFATKALAQGGITMGEEKKKDNTGGIRQPPQLLSIMELGRRAQLSASPDPATQIAMGVLEQNKKQTEELQGLRQDINRPRPPAPGTFGP